MKNKYTKLLSLLVVFSPLFCAARDSAFNKAVDRTVAQKTALVDVWVQLARPVYASEVMFRRPRGKDVVIRLDYKEKQCQGRLFAHSKQVYVPITCVVEDKYRAHQLVLKFASGDLVKKSAKDVQLAENSARIAL